MAVTPEQLEQVSAGLKAHVGNLLGLTSKKVDDLDGKLANALEELRKTTAPAETVEQIKALSARMETRLDELEAKGMKPRIDGKILDFAQAVHDSEMYRQQWAQRQFGAIPGRSSRTKMAGGLAVPSLLFVAAFSTASQSRNVLGSAELSSFVEDYVRPGVVMRSALSPTLVDLVPRVQAPGKEVYRYQFETAEGGFGYLRTTLGGNVNAIDTTLTLTSTIGFMVGGGIRIHAAAGMILCEILTVDSPTVVTLTAAVGATAAIGEGVTSEVYGAIGEGDSKPYAFLEGDSASVNFLTFPMLLGITEQRLNTLPNFRAWGESRLRQAAKANTNWHIAYGNDTAYQLQGFMTRASALTLLWSDCEVGSTRADAVLIAAEMIRSNGTISVTMCRRDWGKILRSKAVDGHYIYGKLGPVSIINTAGLKAIGDIIVYIDDAMKENDFLVADHLRSSELADQMSSQFAIGYVGNDFAENKLRARYEDTIAHAIVSDEYYVVCQWDSAPV